METTKFKVVDKSTGEVIGYEFLKDGEWQHCLPGKENEFVSFGVFQGKKVGREYVRHQFTGITDVNNQEIYDGDIILHWVSRWPDSKYQGQVVYNDKCAAWQYQYPNINDHPVTDFMHQPHFFEIIGNIYSPPEHFSRAVGH